MSCPEILRVNTSKLSVFMTERVQTQPWITVAQGYKNMETGEILSWKGDQKMWQPKLTTSCFSGILHVLETVTWAFLSETGLYLQSKDCHLEM